MSIDAGSPHQQLRRLLAPDHEAVDARFAGYDLRDGGAYRAFLLAHARALPAVEAALAAAPGPPPLRPRAPLLAADLAALDAAMPAPLPIARPATQAAAWGMAYVLEGSRLGGAMLARGVGEGFPRAYLADAHRPGEWRAFTKAMDAALATDADVAAAMAAGRAVFALYGAAAGSDAPARALVADGR